MAFVSGHPDKAGKLAARYGVEAANIYNYENYDSIKDNPDDRRRLRRAAEQHARRVHDPRVEGGQARPLREADGQHAGRVPGDDRRGEGRPAAS